MIHWGFNGSYACLYVFGSVLACVQMFKKLSCLPNVFGCVFACLLSVQMFHACHVFDSVLACAKSAYVFQKLSYLLCGLCLSLSSLTLPHTVRLFYISLRSLLAPQQECTVLSFSLMWRHGHSHQLTSSHALRVLNYGHTFLRCIDLLHCIAYTAVLHCGHTFLNLS